MARRAPSELERLRKENAAMRAQLDALFDRAAAASAAEMFRPKLGDLNYAFCPRCDQPFEFNPLLVPRCTVNGITLPICSCCVGKAMTERFLSGQGYEFPHKDAYGGYSTWMRESGRMITMNFDKELEQLISSSRTEH